jgi:recombination protein RecT
MVPALVEKRENIRGLLKKSMGQLQMALPRHMDANRLFRVAMTSIQKTPDLLNCDPISLVGAVIQCAQLGLEPDGVLGHAYLVPFSGKVTFIAGYRGLIDLARRSGQIESIAAHIVHDGDTFDFAYGLNERLDHKPVLAAEDTPEAPVVAVYAYAKLKDGGFAFEVMSKGQVEAVRGRSKAGKNGPWVTDWEEMARKTVIRRLCKYLPLSVEFATAVKLDGQAEAGEDQNLEIVVVGEDDFDETQAATDQKAADLKGRVKAAKEVKETAPETAPPSTPPAGGNGQLPEAAPAQEPDKPPRTKDESIEMVSAACFDLCKKRSLPMEDLLLEMFPTTPKGKMTLEQWDQFYRTLI